MATPHNKAEKGQIAKTVLMPGDPLRAKMIAERYLEDAVLVNQVRNIYCYTGKYHGKPVSVMASGMGMPSIGIYSYELYSAYDVEEIIRIGSAGAYTAEVDIMDVVLADSVWSETSFGKAQNGDDSEWRYPSKELNDRIRETFASTGKKVYEGTIHSSDVFYHEDGGDDILQKKVKEHSLVCVEMESFALFHNAAVLGKKAACLLTISDSFVNGGSISAEDRQNALLEMIELALEAAVR